MQGYGRGDYSDPSLGFPEMALFWGLECRQVYMWSQKGNSLQTTQGLYSSLKTRYLMH